jgi:hypothetical protein
MYDGVYVREQAAPERGKGPSAWSKRQHPSDPSNSAGVGAPYIHTPHIDFILELKDHSISSETVIHTPYT